MQGSGTLDSSRQAAKRIALADLRREYEGEAICKTNLPEDPMSLFGRWFDTALERCLEPNAMVLSTVGQQGPSSRVVLLKGVDENGLTFFTNYRSRKACELEVEPRASLNFFWIELHRQVRIEGMTQRIEDEASDRYFASRPRASQLGAWASPQSDTIDDRATLEAELARVTLRFESRDTVPRPPHWGGIRLVPEMVEFWQGQPSRLHDRAVYRRDDSGWSTSRLAP